MANSSLATDRFTKSVTGMSGSIGTMGSTAATTARTAGASATGEAVVLITQVISLNGR